MLLKEIIIRINKLFRATTGKIFGPGDKWKWWQQLHKEHIDMGTGEGGSGPFTPHVDVL